MKTEELLSRISSKLKKWVENDELDIREFSSMPSPSNVSFDLLNVEWSKQSARFVILTSIQADARLRVKRLKDALEQLESELSEKIRTKYDDKKPTEPFIKRKFWRYAEYKELRSQIIRAERHADMITGAVNSMVHKKDALSNISANLRKEWFSDPDSNSDRNDAKQERFEREYKKKRRER